MDLLLASDGQQVEMNMHTFTVPVLNVLWEMVAGHAFKWSNERVKEVLALVNWAFSAPISVIVVQVPWLRFFFPALTGYNKVELMFWPNLLCLTSCMNPDHAEDQGGEGDAGAGGGGGDGAHEGC